MYITLKERKKVREREKVRLANGSMVNLGGYYLENISQVEGWDKLKKMNNLRLILSGNEFKEIPNLDFLPNLKELFIQNNRITRIENLENLKSLTGLFLDGNKITKIENLNCPSLKILTISVNKIEKLENLEHLGYLSELEVDVNEINSIKNFIPPKQLESLSISYNPIPKNEVIDFKKKFPEIDVRFVSNA